jgi:hypothetical protein
MEGEGGEGKREWMGRYGKRGWRGMNGKGWRDMEGVGGEVWKEGEEREHAVEEELWKRRNVLKN